MSRRRKIFAQPAQAEAAPQPQASAIPAWRDLHWKKQVKLAQDMGADVVTALEARDWLETHHGDSR